jgi:hypothetical protein
VQGARSFARGQMTASGRGHSLVSCPKSPGACGLRSERRHSALEVQVASALQASSTAPGCLAFRRPCVRNHRFCCGNVITISCTYSPPRLSPDRSKAFTVRCTSLAERRSRVRRPDLQVYSRVYGMSAARPPILLCNVFRAADERKARRRVCSRNISLAFLTSEMYPTAASEAAPYK